LKVGSLELAELGRGRQRVPEEPRRIDAYLHRGDGSRLRADFAEGATLAVRAILAVPAVLTRTGEAPGRQGEDDRKPREKEQRPSDRLTHWSRFYTLTPEEPV